MRRIFPTLLLTLLAFFLGVAAFWGFSRSGARVTQEDATVLLEQVRKVAKLVTVEGDVSEVFNSKQTRNVTMYLPLPTRFSFAKEALVQVQGTVLVGYDLEKVSFAVDLDSRTLSIRNLPEPEILAVDHELRYTNLEESWFNSFTAEDYSALNRKAKERLRAAARESQLIDQAREQGNALIETIGILARGAGFRVTVEGREPEILPGG